jgi:hypothetical protein
MKRQASFVLRALFVFVFPSTNNFGVSSMVKL